VQALSKEVQTDFTIARMLSFVDFARNLPAENITAYTVPGVQFDSEHGRACYAVNKQALIELLNAHFCAVGECYDDGDLNTSVYYGIDYGQTYGTHETDFSR